MAGPDRARPPQSLGAANPAFRSPLAVIVFLAVAAVGLTADLLSKEYVFNSLLNDPYMVERVEWARKLPPHPTTTYDVLHLGYLKFQRHVLPGVDFTLSTNEGVVFGLPMPRPVVAVVTVITVILVGYFFATSERKARLVHVALAAILAGALGNLYDRLFARVAVDQLEPIRYHVRDFIDCNNLYWPWIFNVADILLVVGVALLILHWAAASGRAAKAKKAPA